MKRWFELLGNAAGILGILVCLVAGLIRLRGAYDLVGVEPMSLFIGGMGLILAGCLAKTHGLSGTTR